MMHHPLKISKAGAMIHGLISRRHLRALPAGGPGLQVYVRFGSARDDCRQVGICDIRLRPADGQTVPQGYTRAILCRARPAVLILHVVKASLPAAVQAAQFADGCLRLKEPFALPRPVWRRLKIRTKIYLEAGCYAVADLGGHLSLALPLRPPPPGGEPGDRRTRDKGTGGRVDRGQETRGCRPDFTGANPETT